MHLNSIEASAAAVKAEPQQPPVVFFSTSRQPAVVEQQLSSNVPVVVNMPHADRPQRRRKAKSKDYDDLGGKSQLSSVEQEQRQKQLHASSCLTMHD